MKKFSRILVDMIRETLLPTIRGPAKLFLHTESSSGIVLVFTTLLALLLANSGFQDWYFAFRDTPVSITVGGFSITKDLTLVVNDGLMVLFFYLVGLEIKREFLAGELKNPRSAGISFAAALGGMLVPAAIYIYINWNQPVLIDGWAIPMATDIAFAVGLLALLGKAVPFALKIFLLSLAIVDDLGAVLVIAIFYTDEVHISSLLVGFFFLMLLYLFSAAGVRHIFFGIFTGLIVWIAFFFSGVHATIAGVLMGLITPAAMKMNSRLDDTTFLDRWIKALHPWVAFLIIPIFALVNAGVSFGDVKFEEFAMSTSVLGIILGLTLGKPLGIFVFSWLSVRLGFGVLPRGSNWIQILSVGMLAGIGFTLSLFISALSFDSGATALEHSKIAILFASSIAAALGMAMLWFTTGFFGGKKRRVRKRSIKKGRA